MSTFSAASPNLGPGEGTSRSRARHARLEHRGDQPGPCVKRTHPARREVRPRQDDAKRRPRGRISLRVCRAQRRNDQECPLFIGRPRVRDVERWIQESRLRSHDPKRCPTRSDGSCRLSLRAIRHAGLDTERRRGDGDIRKALIPLVPREKHVPGTQARRRFPRLLDRGHPPMPKRPDCGPPLQRGPPQRRCPRTKTRQPRPRSRAARQ